MSELSLDLLGESTLAGHSVVRHGDGTQVLIRELTRRDL